MVIFLGDLLFGDDSRRVAEGKASRENKHPYVGRRQKIKIPSRGQSKEDRTNGTTDSKILSYQAAYVGE